MVDRAELRKLAEAATPGPWSVIIDDDGNPLSGRPGVFASEDLDCAIIHWDGFVKEYWRSARGDKEIHANAAYIAAANPDTVLGLLDEIGRLDRALKGQFAMNGELIRITNKHSALSQNAENDKEGLRECNSILTEENETLRAERDKFRASAVRLKEALKEVLDWDALAGEGWDSEWIAEYEKNKKDGRDALADPEVEKL